MRVHMECAPTGVRSQERIPYTPVVIPGKVNI